MDREKVINQLETDYREAERRGWILVPVGRKIVNDALALLALLKEQGTVPVKEDKINKCECGETVCRYYHPKFCGFCGRELLWY